MSAARFRLRSRPRVRLAAAATGTVVLATGLALVPAQAAPQTARSRGVAAGTKYAPAEGHETKPDLDARQGTSRTARAAVARRSAAVSNRPAARTLVRSLGSEALLDIDGTTGTVRMLARLDGYLTAPSSAAPASIALRYVRAHLAALGLREGDLATLHLTRDYRDIGGTDHLSWTQSAGGVTVFGNGLQAAVTRTGRLLSLAGSPVTGLKNAAGRARAVPTASAAIVRARRDLAESARPGRADTAKRMLFVTASGSHLGWQVETMSAAHPATTVVDAGTGAVLYRRSLSDDSNSSTDRAARASSTASSASTGLAYRYFPDAPVGGTARDVNFTARGWLSGDARILSGNNSHAYSDVNDDNLPEPSEEVAPRTGHSWDYALKPFHLPGVSFCDNPYPCTWNPNEPYSWRVNRAQNTTQVFFFVNTWHDHLQAAPIGFTEAAGNFQVRNHTGEGVGGDQVDTQTEDGADTANGLPDGGHIDNANMNTPPDGQSPTMQMYLQHAPGTSYPEGDPFAPTDVGDEADTVYHEYTHGLTNRLVVDAAGNSTLGPVQAGSMGEAWSDWYAMDYLVAQGYQQDVPNKVDVVLFQFDGAGVALDRTEPIDCKVGSTAEACNGGATGHPGGYTYADFGKVIGQPEVHADGEIWSQTLWDLRDRLGSSLTESLVTRALELSPADPSFLDERNAILLADQALTGGRHHAAIWQVFAHRGMGYFAGSLSGEDSAPGADFHVPPTGTARGSITGTVTDADSGQPLSGVTVSLAFQGSPGLANPSATTDAAGHYTIGPVPVGTYPKLVASAPGYGGAATSVTVTTGGATQDLSLRRDWAATAGGATVGSFTGPDYSPDCGPAQALDQSQSTGWESSAGNDNADPTNVFVPKTLTVVLPRAVDVTSFGVDPSASCGDGASASTGDYRIETSPDGSAWTTAAQGTFTRADDGSLNTVTPTGGASAVRYVRFTMLSNQTPNFATNCPAGAYSGCAYSDLTELEVFGT